MKELSIEEKAKAYDEAFKEASVAHKDEDRHLKATLERIFPELKESEDERIKKELISFLQLPHPQFAGERKQEKWIAWLEKQGEQKLADKVEPKFHEGQWIVCCDYEPEQIIGIRTNAYEMSNGDIRPFYMIDNNHNIRPWTIQDAKDGDVLVRNSYPDGKSICLFKEFTKPFSMTLYCSMNNKGQFLPYNNSDYYHRYDVTLCPATKEQRDLLFQKIYEAGYKWDAEKKELKKFEQKSAENEELTEFDKAVGVSIGTWNPKTPEQIQSVKAVSKKLLKLAKKQINDEQKVAWSKEDEKNLLEINCLIGNYKTGDDEYKLESWLKSLKDKIVSQPQWKPRINSTNSI